ncbi:MAG: trypsin-like peptidase domain-containing protein [Clostridia bacterium]|nr:trypsin-like peptidase domain-containing protein [Clostridia bacterium]
MNDFENLNEFNNITEPSFTEAPKSVERSYTPQNEYSPFVNGSASAPEQSYTNPYNTKNTTNNQGKSEKKITMGTVLFSSAVTAIVSSILTCVIALSFGAGGFALLFSNPSKTNNPSTSDSGNEGTKNIVIDATAETAAVAVAEKVNPSVVGIMVTFENYNFFYGNQTAQSQGSGIIYNTDGYIITNYHVIEGAVKQNGKISVYLYNDLENGISATVVGYDVSADLAVIKISKSGLTPIELGDSDKVVVGQTAIAVGNPGGLSFSGSVSMGIISGLNRTIQLESSSEITLIQTDTAINPGNSGGALTDSQGKLIGVNSAKLSGDGYEGMGFAIPVNDMKEICDRIINKQNSPKPYLGVSLSSYYTSALLNQYGYPAGVVVDDVVEDSPAYNAGIERGDIITKFNGKEVTDIATFTSEKDKCNPGDSATLIVYRNGKNYSVKITLGVANS